MRQLILFFAKYRSTLLLLVFVLIALLRHSLKNPLAEHRLNNVGFGAVATVHNGLSGWKQYWRLEAINEELARENARLRSGGTRASANHFSNSNENDFSYNGPKPFSKETAILMMADSVEAGSKSIKNPTIDILKTFVNQIIDNQMFEKQFTNSDITLAEIEKVKKVLINKLININHLRVEYPK